MKERILWFIFNLTMITGIATLVAVFAWMLTYAGILLWESYR